MKKAERNQLLEILNSVHDLHRNIAVLYDNGDIESVCGLLEKCQAVAIQVGEVIESLAGQGTSAVTELEKYCEALYLCTQNDSWKNGNAMIRKPEDIISMAERAVKRLEVQKEIVFLPYKADMWDSLEGEWKKAIEDPSCDVYVIVVPYYDKNPDGSFRTLHYEADRFPEEVEITHFDAYSLEKHHPDQIYIHNPYDEYNLVTSVHPYFYASNIKQYTEELIYIPYFVHQKNRVKDDYVCLPGVLYADKVLLQSEKVVEQYKHFYFEAFGKNTDKFIASGSSKLNRIESEQKDEIPSEWNEFIFDGEKRRKVVFFNTHLSCLMKAHSDLFFDKIEEIFETFHENPEVVLLWRPHPLAISTAESMNPEVLPRYLELIERYKREKMGIFDDSPDVHRAVAISDAYYGSRSSVVEMFREQKKPIMIMNLRFQRGEMIKSE